jgi:hypothetical protein
MPGPMPYYLEKGPALSILEAFLNDSPTSRLVATLDKLRATTDGGQPKHRLTDCGAFDTASLDFTPPGSSKKMTSKAWKRHLDQHWFGIVSAKGAKTDPSQAKNLKAASSWWIGYWGDDIEGIVRETMIRAIETAYRIPHGAPIPISGERWPIELFWKCGQAWVEGWVTWRQLPQAGTGLVTVTFATPAEDTGAHFLWWSPVPDAGDKAGRGDPFALGVDQLGRERQGMVVITHARNLPTTRAPHEIDDQMRGELTLPPPGATYRGSGPIVAVRPAEIRGGVASTPRTWAPIGGQP